MRAFVRWLVAACCGWLLSGCASLTNPVLVGLPAKQVPPELLASSKQGTSTIPLSLLGQEPPAAYRLAAGDVLGVWIEGVLGDIKQPPPVHFPDTGGGVPALGYPVPVREDGTVVLPLVGALSVQGKTIEEAYEAIRAAYTNRRKIIVPGQERISVTLLRRRQYHVLVIRQDSNAPLAPQPGTSGSTRGIGFTFGTPTQSTGTKRGTGYAVDLPAYENDVLNALALTGGLPGLDAVNEVVIERGAVRGKLDRTALQRAVEEHAPGCDPLGRAGGSGQTIRIPLRLPPGEAPSVKPEDVILQNGDIVFIEARDAELFYTGGLLPPGEFVLPRDHDLDVVEAVSRVGGPLVSGGINTININGALFPPGIGFASPSLLTVVRRTPNGGQFSIRVDLNCALNDPRERILVQKGDVLILQEKPGEAIVRYFNQMFNLELLGTIIRRQDLTGTATLRVP